MVEIGVFGGFTCSRRPRFLRPQARRRRRCCGGRRRTSGRARRTFRCVFLGVEAEFSALPAKYMAGRAPARRERVHLRVARPRHPAAAAVSRGAVRDGRLRADGRVVGAPVAGKDIDPVGHYGGGVKYFVNRYLRCASTSATTSPRRRPSRSTGRATLQATLGLSVTLNPQEAAAAAGRPGSRQGRVPQRRRQVPRHAGHRARRLPRQGLGRRQVHGLGRQVPGGPGRGARRLPAEATATSDGFLDEVDKCPDEPGVAPDGCPLRDKDGDGILDKDDKCVTSRRPQRLRGHRRLPRRAAEGGHEVHRGDPRASTSTSTRTTIKKNSAPTLDAAAKIFKEYPDLKVEISGHTDDVGTREYNVDLAPARRVGQAYLVSKGVAAERITTRGAGPDEPIADNGTPRPAREEPPHRVQDRARIVTHREAGAVPDPPGRRSPRSLWLPASALRRAAGAGRRSGGARRWPAARAARPGRRRAAGSAGRRRA
jgi:outer membrane protein OmpA-like peptidoglycan-associated protein